MPTSSIIPKKSRSGRSRRGRKCDTIPKLVDVLHQIQCPQSDCCDKKTSKLTNTSSLPVLHETPNIKPDDMSIWSWELKRQRYGAPPSKSQFRTAKFRWQESSENQSCTEDCPKRKYINPFQSRRKSILSGAQKRRIVERWGKMWDSALSDLQFDRTVFENNPDGEQTYKTDNERINDGCQKLHAIAKMNQNIITMLMKKFVSGPPGKLYTLNRIEAAQCWSRIVNDRGLVKDHCCIDLPPKPFRRKFNIASLKTPIALRKEAKSNILKKMSMFKLPPPDSTMKKPDIDPMKVQMDSTTEEASSFKKNPAYWLDSKVVPPVPPGFKEEVFHIEPQYDPTGEIRRDLRKAKETAKRYTRFAHIIEKAVHVIPNLDRMNRAMDEHFVARDPQIRRQTLLHNFFSSPKMDTSPEFKKDAMYATILSRNDNPKGAVVKNPFPYSLAEMSKSKSTTNIRTRK